MTKTFKIAISTAALLAHAIPAFALTLPLPSATTHSSSAPECRRDASDPFDLGARAFQGIDAGKCIKFDFRPIVVLSPAEMAAHHVPAKPNHVAIANVAHADTVADGFYIASIPVSTAYEARFLIEHFVIAEGTPFAIDPGHTMMRVFFSSDVVLYEQRDGKSGVKFTTRELVFSVQSSSRFATDVGLLSRITDGSFSLSGAVFTFPGKFKNHVSPLTNPVEQWKTNIAPSQVAEYVSRYIQKADRDAAKKPYLIATANCATEIFRILDRIYTYSASQQIDIDRVRESEWVPSKTPLSLEARGLLEIDSGKMNDINAEI